MKKPLFILILFFLCCLSLNCGYTTGSLLPSRLRTIYVQPFKNSIAYTLESNRQSYVPLMEIDIQKAVIDRFLYDGKLKIAKEETADLILSGELVNYSKSGLRYTDNDDVEEYRIQIAVNLVLWDTAKDQAFWEEKAFVGEATYFVSGALAKSESAAVSDAIADLARRVIERTMDNW
ncbi:MAG: LptE family protein [Candidatus Omnitrophota bacterium]